MENKIRTFRDLYAWKEAHLLAVLTYKTVRLFPKEEIYGLVSQMKRAAVSISSNIAEGFSRRTGKDKTHFYTMSAGSLTELQNQFLLAKDLDFISEKQFEEIDYQIVTVHKLLNALIAKTQNFT